MKRTICALLLTLLTSAVQAADKPLVLDVWPGKPPGETGAFGAEKVTNQKNPVDRHITNVTKPTISVFLAPKDTPPCFFAHAGDDGVKAENSIAMYLALKKAKVAAELHIYTTGGHGFGLRPSDKPCSTWPKRCEEWLAVQGLLKTASAK